MLAGSSAALSFRPGDASAIVDAPPHPPDVPPAVIAHSPPRPNISRGPDALQLLSANPWLGPGPRQFQMDLKVTTDYPAGEELEVVVYGRLTARSQFQAALGWRVSGPFYDAAVAAQQAGQRPARRAGREHPGQPADGG